MSKVLVIRHPKVEGEGKGGTKDTRDIASGLSAEGEEQVDKIIAALTVIFPPTQVICGEAPRYRQVGGRIAQAFLAELTISTEVQQEGGRSEGEQRVAKLRSHQKALWAAIDQALDGAVIITSNPLLEGSLHQGEITLEAMETHRQDYRTDPGNAVLFENGKPIARINIFW